MAPTTTICGYTAAAAGHHTGEVCNQPALPGRYVTLPAVGERRSACAIHADPLPASGRCTRTDAHSVGECADHTAQPVPGQYAEIEQRTREGATRSVVLITSAEPSPEGYVYVGWTNAQPGGGWDRTLGSWGFFRQYPEQREYGTHVVRTMPLQREPARHVGDWPRDVLVAEGEALVGAVMATPHTVPMTTPRGLEPWVLSEREVRDIVAHGKGQRLLETCLAWAPEGCPQCGRDIDRLGGNPECEACAAEPMLDTPAGAGDAVEAYRG